MSKAPTPASRPSTSTISPAERRGWIHFGIAVAILAVFGFGWGPVMSALKWYTRKDPVPWPKVLDAEGNIVRVLVDKKTFRNISLPDRIGPYHKITADGVLRAEKDGLPDGEVILPEDVMSPLKIGTSLDEMRWSQRTSNWYVSRIYRDTRPNRRFEMWGLDIYYYTGGTDTVPHVPEVCGAAGGMTIGGRRNLLLENPTAPPAWRNLKAQAITLKWTDVNTGTEQTRVQYYCFSVNGRPQSSREAVRLGLAKPWLRYVYFAKIQWYPLNMLANPADADDEGREFLQICLPTVLKELPSHQQVEQLYGPQESKR